MDVNDYALHIEKIQKRFSHLRNVRQGYTGLVLFLIFVLLYITILSRQHRAAAVNGANDAFQRYFEQLRGDVVYNQHPDTTSCYKWLCTQVIAKLLEKSWTEPGKNSEDGQLVGHITSEYFHVVGGIIMTAVKGGKKDCFRGLPCYEENMLRDPYYEIDVPGEHGKVKVPYFPEQNGYSVVIPASTSEENRNKLMDAYTGLFGPDTREIWLETVVFNPSGVKTVTSVGYGAHVSIYNSPEFQTRMQSIPYHWYQPETIIGSYCLEILAICYAGYSFVYPMFVFRYRQPVLTNDVRKDKRKWNRWHQRWSSLPGHGGRPFLGLPTALWGTLLVSIIAWHWLGYEYSNLGAFGDPDLDWLFMDPLSGAGDKLSEKMVGAIHSGSTYIWPYINGIRHLSQMYAFYLGLHVLGVVLVVIRSMQYLTFQKRLSSVCDTFTGISDELVHMGFVTMLVCFLFGVINSLAFGSYDPAFTNFGTSFVDMVLVCFGLFKPAAGTIFVESLFKYSPHVIITADFMTWVPIVLQIGFKFLVILLLFKLLMGVIMEGYKKHSRHRETSQSMREDLHILLTHLKHELVDGYIIQEGYVSFMHVALALGRVTSNESRPSWQESYLGLESPEEVKSVLNSIFEEGMPERVRHAVTLNKLKPCGDVEVAYVLWTYGMDRSSAFSKYSHDLAVKQGEAHAKVELQKLNAKRMEAGGMVADLRRTLQVMKGPDDKFVSKIFKDHDIFDLGFMTHDSMPHVFHQLGYNLRKKDPAWPYLLQKVLKSYDQNEDNNTSLKELIQMVNDRRLTGHYEPHYEPTDPGQPRGLLGGYAVARAVKSWKRSGVAPTLATPLLEADGQAGSHGQAGADLEDKSEEQIVLGADEDADPDVHDAGLHM
jgi:hypothetical protein